jgi:hypothetical protein
VVGTYLRKKIDQRKLEALKSIRGERAEDDASLTKLVSTSNGQGGSCACRGIVLNLYQGLRQNGFENNRLGLQGNCKSLRYGVIC